MILASRVQRRLVYFGASALVTLILLLLAVPIGLFLSLVPSDWEHNHLPNNLMLVLFLIVTGIVGVVVGYDSAITPALRTQWIWPLTGWQLANMALATRAAGA